MSPCWQADITLQTGSKSVIRSLDHIHKVKSRERNCVPESPQQRPCLYNTEWSGFSGLKEGQSTVPHPERLMKPCAVTTPWILCNYQKRKMASPFQAAGCHNPALCKSPSTFAHKWICTSPPNAAQSPCVCSGI
ncbi:hypothetical protein CHARACLAT_015178 [Characodon lateralis]|uniref:Uncharacterized protein n=1 Tax=Characodon lateralis TaxID=208331 RepID=A0ABU7CRV1_9TELE|nr:hypothetical protein [Characodon lateralis]